MGCVNSSRENRGFEMMDPGWGFNLGSRGCPLGGLVEANRESTGKDRTGAVLGGVVLCHIGVGTIALSTRGMLYADDGGARIRLLKVHASLLAAPPPIFFSPPSTRSAVTSQARTLSRSPRRSRLSTSFTTTTDAPSLPLSARAGAFRLSTTSSAPRSSPATTMASPPAFDRAVSLVNRCSDSKSPYVRSHMSNPTAWQLWGAETIALAQRTNRLLFVSIGYSACHWCHVMAAESFADPRIAQLLNEHFIPVKLDREERPDIDRQYMDFQQATSGGGGWPLNVFVTPDLEPIFGGTYWPGPHSARAQMGASFEDILLKVIKVWKEQEAKVRENGKSILGQLREFAQEGTLGGGAGDGEDELELTILDDAFQHYRQRFDRKFGGFGSAPKFPTPMHIRALLRLSSHRAVVRDIVGDKECEESLEMAVKTLEAMAKGGIKDQVGHGFARYSVTRDWSLPHFEKMLYDNAQLLPLYLDAYLTTKNALFLETLQDVATYLTTEPMLSPLGGINASEDADSLPTAADKTKREGAYYVWTAEEFQTILDGEEAAVCAKYWDVRPDGNVDRRFDSQGELVGQNTLCVKYEPSQLAAELKMSEDDVRSIISSGRRKLRAFREANRPRPALDDKIVTAWNGLAIGGLARAGAALAATLPDLSRNYLAAAESAVSCIRTHLYHEPTRILRRVYREGPGETPGFADDYAFLISGLLDLYEATFDETHLAFADTLQQAQLSLFWDTAANAAFFSTPADQPDILIRTKDAMDNAEPSVNGVSAANLFRLASLLDDAAYAAHAKRCVAAFEVEITQHPGLFSGLLAPVVASKLGMRGLMVAGAGATAQYALRRAHESVRPNITVLRIGAGGGANGSGQDRWLRERNSLVRELGADTEMVQLCEDGRCRLLTTRTELDELFAVAGSSA
nr:spermatogenesis-associated protein 20 [Quercus suber]